MSEFQQLRTRVIAKEHEINSCQFAEWYPLLQKNSIKSIILDLDEDFISYLKEDGIFLPDSSSGYLENDALSDDEDLVPVKQETTRKRQFPELEKKIKDSIAKFDGEVFIKFNWSAPRDAVWMNNGSLKCFSAPDIYLLLKSSDRIIYDLESMYEYCGSEKKSPEKATLVIRKWANLLPSQEFRLFVKDNELLGLCQRECTTYFPFLKTTIDDISEKICDFFDKEVSGKLPLSNYAMDVYIDKKDRVWVIDVNPYGEPTCPLLFEWPEIDSLQEFTVKIVNSEVEKMNSTLGTSRGPVDVHLAPDFHDFLNICKKQAQEADDSSSDDEEGAP